MHLLKLFFIRITYAMVKTIRSLSHQAIEIDYDLDQVKSFIDRLPFELTEAQKSSVNEIFQRFKSTNTYESITSR